MAYKTNISTVGIQNHPTYTNLNVITGGGRLDAHVRTSHPFYWYELKLPVQTLSAALLFTGEGSVLGAGMGHEGFSSTLT